MVLDIVVHGFERLCDEEWSCCEKKYEVVGVKRAAEKENFGKVQWQPQVKSLQLSQHKNAEGQVKQNHHGGACPLRNRRKGHHEIAKDLFRTGIDIIMKKKCDHAGVKNRVIDKIVRRVMIFVQGFVNSQKP